MFLYLYVLIKTLNHSLIISQLKALYEYSCEQGIDSMMGFYVQSFFLCLVGVPQNTHKLIGDSTQFFVVARSGSLYFSMFSYWNYLMMRSRAYVADCTPVLQVS